MNTDNFIPFEQVAIPDTLSELLRRVVADMRTVKNRDGVEFDMAHWASYSHSDNCAVCAAGAYVLAECFPNGFTGEFTDITSVIDYIDNRGRSSNCVTELIDDLRKRDTYSVKMFYPDIPNSVVRDMGELMDEVSYSDDGGYDAYDYRDVVKLFNTLATFLESRDC